MFDIELDLVSESGIIVEASFYLEVDEETKMVVEAEQFLLLVLVLLKNCLEVWSIASFSQVSGATIEAVTILWSEWLDVYAEFLTDDCLVVVDSTAVMTGHLVFLDGHHNVIRKTKMDECVHAASELLEHFGLLDNSWEIGEDESVSSSVGKSEQLEGDLVLNLCVNITSVEHLFNLEEKWMRKVFGLSSKLLDIKHNLSQGDYRQSHVDAESLDNFILERVWCSKENDLWVGGPSLHELLALWSDECFQHF